MHFCIFTFSNKISNAEKWARSSKAAILSLINLCLLKMQKRKTHYSYALCNSRQLFNFPWYNLSHLSKKNFRVTIFLNLIFTRLNWYSNFMEFIILLYYKSEDRMMISLIVFCYCLKFSSHSLNRIMLFNIFKECITNLKLTEARAPSYNRAL